MVSSVPFHYDGILVAMSQWFAEAVGLRQHKWPRHGCRGHVRYGSQIEQLSHVIPSPIVLKSFEYIQ